VTNKYLSILRGINVSGQKKINMGDLKQLYQELGFSEVISYIQSGNVIFTSEMDHKSEISEKINQGISDKYGFNVPVQVLSVAQFDKVFKQQPFTDVDTIQDGAKVLVTFLSKVPEQENIQTLLTHVLAPERLVVKHQTVYLHCPNGYGRSKLSNTFIEKKLGLQATTRNIKTVSKLCELALASNS
jgi:uncharacterized protein (DUF1697 family)